MSDDAPYSFSLTLKDHYAFAVDFGDSGIPPFTLDEAPPLGRGEGPNPTQLLASAVAGCLGASLLFCLRKSRIDVPELRTNVTVTSGRNTKGRLRVQKITVRLAPTVPAEQQERMARCLEIFEDFCVVTAAVRDGIEIDVKVETQTP